MKDAQSGKEVGIGESVMLEEGTQVLLSLQELGEVDQSADGWFVISTIILPANILL